MCTDRAKNVINILMERMQIDPSLTSPQIPEFAERIREFIDATAIQVDTDDSIEKYSSTED